MKNILLSIETNRIRKTGKQFSEGFSSSTDGYRKGTEDKYVSVSEFDGYSVSVSVMEVSEDFLKKLEEEKTAAKKAISGLNAHINIHFDVSEIRNIETNVINTFSFEIEEGFLENFPTYGHSAFNAVIHKGIRGAYVDQVGCNPKVMGDLYKLDSESVVYEKELKQIAEMAIEDLNLTVDERYSVL